MSFFFPTPSGHHRVLLQAWRRHAVASVSAPTTTPASSPAPAAYPPLCGSSATGGSPPMRSRRPTTFGPSCQARPRCYTIQGRAGRRDVTRREHRLAASGRAGHRLAVRGRGGWPLVRGGWGWLSSRRGGSHV